MPERNSKNLSAATGADNVVNVDGSGGSAGDSIKGPAVVGGNHVAGSPGAGCDGCAEEIDGDDDIDGNARCRACDPRTKEHREEMQKLGWLPRMPRMPKKPTQKMRKKDDVDMKQIADEDGSEESEEATRPVVGGARGGENWRIERPTQTLVDLAAPRENGINSLEDKDAVIESVICEVNDDAKKA